MEKKTTAETIEGDTPQRRRSHRALILASILVLVAVVTFGVTGLLVTIFEHQQESRRPFVRVVEVDETSSDPVPWGRNWPHQFDSYQRTVDITHTRFGGSSAMPASKLEEDPWLRRLYAGYAFSLDYRERRGHAYMLHDQEVTERVTRRVQSGACLHCHASVLPTYRRLGLEAAGRPADAEALGRAFEPEAVMAGFRLMSTMTYAEAHAELLRTPDGTPGEDVPLFPGGSAEPATPVATGTDPHGGDPYGGEAHPVSCVDCHDPVSMQIRITRPGFLTGIAALAGSEQPLPHLPSIERWRAGKRTTPYDPNQEASRQELRSFVCAQCHVEYYCASKEALFFPWDQGINVEGIEATYDAHRFPDGDVFHDYVHAETGALAYKAQHPEFELWNQGVHARSGVSCADCHMPYQREGAMKVSSHWVRSPLLNINSSCQACHKVPEEELLAKVHTIQDRTRALIQRSATAMTDMLDAIGQAQAAGADAAALAPILELQRKAMWRLDFISSENSMGFHADQEAARILAESIDYSRQAQARALLLRAPAAPQPEPALDAVEGVTPTCEAPPGPHRTRADAAPLGETAPGQ